MGTFEALELSGHRVKAMEAKKKYEIGGFTVIPFEVFHDAAEPFGFLIQHGDNRILFFTDTYYLSLKFPGLTNIIGEVNYSDDILDDNIQEGRIHPTVRGRVLNSHMSLRTFKDMLKANNLSKVNNIVLTHLSDGNSDAMRFKQEIEDLTGKNVFVADKGMTIDFSSTPF